MQPTVCVGRGSCSSVGASPPPRVSPIWTQAPGAQHPQSGCVIHLLSQHCSLLIPGLQTSGLPRHLCLPPWPGSKGSPRPWRRAGLDATLPPSPGDLRKRDNLCSLCSGGQCLHVCPPNTLGSGQALGESLLINDTICKQAPPAPTACLLILEARAFLLPLEAFTPATESVLTAVPDTTWAGWPWKWPCSLCGQASAAPCLTPTQAEAAAPRSNGLRRWGGPVPLMGRLWQEGAAESPREASPG